MKKILVIGGAGFIGSHTVVALSEAGYSPVILDNFSNSEEFIIDKINQLTGKKVPLYKADYTNRKKLKDILIKEKIDGVIHFAAYKAVGESVEQPIKYYDNNVSGFIGLLKVLVESNINNLVFSSSAAVYGQPKTARVTEMTYCMPRSPYGSTKSMDEIILYQTCQSNDKLNGIALRYFNVVGAHPSGLIGELAKGKPQNLLPLIIDAIESKTTLNVYGDDYPTPDGTCQRDYIDVVDLADAHIKALDKCFKGSVRYNVYNIGIGKPTSVLELIKTFEQVNKVKVPYKIGPRRPGDPAAYYAVNKKAVKELSWKPKRNLEDSVRDAWQWHKNITSV